MAKKSKEKQKQSQNETSNSSDIFNTLFGATPTDSNIDSLFSDNNPFRRKPNNDNPTASQEPKLGVVEASIENQTDGFFENNDSDSAKLKKRKKKDKNVILDSGSVSEEANEESNGVVSDVILGSEAKEDMIGKLGKKEKKKRKRDEIEAEYAAKRYGVVDMEAEAEKGIGEMVVGEKRKKMDNPENMMVSTEGFDDESKLLRTVFIGNLPLKIKKKALMKEFGSFGEVESVRIRSIPLADVSISYLFFLLCALGVKNYVYVVLPWSLILNVTSFGRMQLQGRLLSLRKNSMIMLAG